MKSKPVVMPSFYVKNPESSSRGHSEQQLGRSVVCRTCHARKPKRGGWSVACAEDRRHFKGA